MPAAFYRTWVVLISSGMVLGCASPLRDLEPMEPELPADHSFVQEDAVAPAYDWWTQLGSPELDALLAQAMSDSPDVQVALERLQSAEAALSQSRADLWPSLSFRAGASHRKDLDNSDTGFSSGSSLSFSAGYEIDLWARRAADIDSAELDFESQRLTLRSAEMMLTGQMVQQYIALLASQESLRIAYSNLEASQELERIVQVKFEAGVVSGMEIAQQRNTTLSLISRLAGLEKNLAVQKRALAALIGSDTLTLPTMNLTLAELNLPAVAAVQPASLLAQRPDIRQANIALWQSHASVWQAESSRWPSLSLSAGLSASDVLNPTGWALSLGESLALPLFDGGKISAQIAQAESAERVAQIEYRRTVRAAMQEALDALDELSYQQEELQNSVLVLANNERLLHLAQIRFDSGDTDFSDLLSAQRTFFSARDSMVSTRQSHLNALIALYLTLGDIPRGG